MSGGAHWEEDKAQRETVRRASVEKGEKKEKGAAVGASGATGRSFGHAYYILLD